jgi:hypothetical protein
MLPPVAASVGEIQIVPAGAAAAWGHPEGTLVQWQGAGWQPDVPRDGQLALVHDEQRMLVYSQGWQALFPVGGLQIGGRAVLAAAPAEVVPPTGGTTVDSEARAALAALIAALIGQGLLEN